MNAMVTVCADCFAANAARLDAERIASTVVTPPLPPQTAAEIQESERRVADTVYRFGSLLPDIPASILEAAIARLEPPASYPRRASCDVDVLGLGHVHVELSCSRRPKPRPPGGRATRYAFYWVAARARRA